MEEETARLTLGTAEDEALGAMEEEAALAPKEEITRLLFLEPFFTETLEEALGAAAELEACLRRTWWEEGRARL